MTRKNSPSIRRTIAMHCDEIEHIRNRIIDLGKWSERDEQEVRHLLSRLEDNVKIRSQKPPPVRPLGNPAVVGLAGFGVTTLLFQCFNFGLMKPGPVLWLGIMYGGLSQFIAGLMEYGNANNFGFSAFTTYGAFWISLVAMLIANDYTKYEAKDQELALFLAAFALYTLIMLIGSSKHNLALFLVFLLLFLGLIFLSMFHFFPHNHILKIIGASILVACALGALYILAHLILLESFKRDVLPVGGPLLSNRTPTVSVKGSMGNGEDRQQEGVTLIQLQAKST
uniref:Uncharacterized protein n=1 Tax=Romanomermis culicivorax TaxID=13658 RepID=A0A915K9B7_ROMCU